MRSSAASGNTKNRPHISDAGQRFGSTKPPAAARGALSVAVLSALLLIAARPALAQASETVLHNFDGKDGSGPNSRLTSDGAGDFYGTTPGGGSAGDGNVYEVSPNGSGGWNEAPIFTFGPEPAGGYTPDLSPVIFDHSGNLFGTAYGGGANFYGVVFELSPSGSNETVLYNFCPEGNPCNVTGAYPIGGLVVDSKGNFYGTTSAGGANGIGTVFELSPSGGTWTEQVIYSIGKGDKAADGLVMDAAGNIFGSTNSTVFELSPNGNGWDANLIHNFKGSPKDGVEGEFCTLVLDQAGNIYGTTASGGKDNAGTVYKLSPVVSGKKKGTYTEKVLYSFKTNGKDGVGPSAGVVFDAGGNIYGTTVGGGKYNAGTVYELALTGTGKYKENILWSFNNTDGNEPESSLILDGSGNLYGTTYKGGANGVGTVFEVTP
jgi:uncharacterized repeat protein (TIGR03803 family)